MIILSPPFDVIEHGDFWWVTSNGFRICALVDIGTPKEYAEHIAGELNLASKIREFLDWKIITYTSLKDYESALETYKKLPDTVVCYSNDMKSLKYGFEVYPQLERHLINMNVARLEKD